MAWILPSAITALDHFNEFPEEEAFMKYLGEVFQVSYAERLRTYSSEYSYFFLKPYTKPALRYGLSGEILALYAPYPEVQARSLIDVADLQQKHKERVHPVWNIIITDDPDTVEHLKQLVAGKDLEVYSIPFSVQELSAKPSAEFVYARLEEYIHGRDLFAFQSALQHDTLFFGRKSLVDDIVGKIENGQNFGLFGLRRSGKTSVLLAVERYLSKMGGYRVLRLDCQSPGVYLMHWNTLLARIASEITGRAGAFVGLAEQVVAFQRAVQEAPAKTLLIFDEVENVSLDLSPASHWNDEFLPFWGAIRAVHQETNGKLVYGVAGVNPHIFDIPLVAGKDNPILLGVAPLYLWPLSLASTREMVRTIGRYMGLEFEEKVYDWLYCQYGGVPFLVRKAVSLVYRKADRKTGDVVILTDFTSRQKWLDDQLGKDIMNMLVVLVQHYPDEFDNLVLLANDDEAWIQEVQESDPTSLTHILEYRVITEDQGNFRFAIETLGRFLKVHGKDMKRAVQTLTASSAPTAYEALPAPQQLELWTRLSRARNSVEPELRTLLYRALLFAYGDKAITRVLEKFSPEKQKSLAGYSLLQIFRGESKALYLKDVKEIALREWDLVKHVFGNDRKAFELKLDQLNADGRADAHANPISDTVVSQVEAIAQDLLKAMAPYLE